MAWLIDGGSLGWQYRRVSAAGLARQGKKIAWMLDGRCGAP